MLTKKILAAVIGAGLFPLAQTIVGSADGTPPFFGRLRAAYARDRVPTIERYHDGQTAPTPAGLGFEPDVVEPAGVPKRHEIAPERLIIEDIAFLAVDQGAQRVLRNAASAARPASTGWAT